MAFPKTPSPEWFVVDLFENAEQAAASLDELTAGLAKAMRSGRFDRQRLVEMAQRFGSRRTQGLVQRALDEDDRVADRRRSWARELTLACARQRVCAR